MKYKLIISAEAESDIENAMDYYEEKQRGLGKRYLLSIKEAIRLVVRNSFAFARIYLEIRKVNTKRFPYSLFYSIEEEQKELVIFAVIHHSRSEKAWTKRLK